MAVSVGQGCQKPRELRLQPDSLASIPGTAVWIPCRCKIWGKSLPLSFLTREMGAISPLFYRVV